jgi:hypothetical protein
MAVREKSQVLESARSEGDGQKLYLIDGGVSKGGAAGRQVIPHSPGELKSRISYWQTCKRSSN